MHLLIVYGWVCRRVEASVPTSKTTTNNAKLGNYSQCHALRELLCLLLAVVRDYDRLCVLLQSLDLYMRTCQLHKQIEHC